MPTPKALELNLSEDEEAKLRTLVKRSSAEQRLVTRAKIVLAAGAGKTNSQVTKEEGVNIKTVQKWRSRWVPLQAIPLTELSVEERLADLPRPGHPLTITADQRCQIQQLACEQPSESGRPITHWTGREIADEIIKRGIVASISARHASRLLKKGG